MLQLVAGPAGRPRHDGQARGVDGHGAADGEVGVFAAHVAAGHDQQLVHVGRAGHDRLGARDHDAPRIALDHMQVAVGVGLFVRPAAAVALGIGHGDAQGQVLVLHAVQVVQEARGVLLGAAGVVDAGRDLADRVERVVREVALGAAGLLADQAHRLQLVEQVAGAGVDVGQPVHPLAAGVLHRRHQRRKPLLQRVVVGQGNGIDAGRQRRLVGHAVDLAAVDEYIRAISPQRFAKLRARHQRGGGGGIHGRGSPAAVVL